jgi:hypothetical protein
MGGCAGGNAHFILRRPPLTPAGGFCVSARLLFDVVARLLTPAASSSPDRPIDSTQLLIARPLDGVCTFITNCLPLSFRKDRTHTPPNPPRRSNGVVPPAPGGRSPGANFLLQPLYQGTCRRLSIGWGMGEGSVARRKGTGGQSSVVDRVVLLVRHLSSSCVNQSPD